jgi:hypothetical protein
MLHNFSCPLENPLIGSPMDQLFFVVINMASDLKNQFLDAHTKRLLTKRLLDKTSLNKTSPQQNVSITKRLLVTKRLLSKRLLDKTSLDLPMSTSTSMSLSVSVSMDTDTDRDMDVDVDTGIFLQSNFCGFIICT